MAAIMGKPEPMRAALAKHFIEVTILRQWRELVGWQTVTAQSAQIDSGYLGQHLVSLLTGVPGRGIGSRGKGADLTDGSEIKVASTLGGVDRPRWNNQLQSEDRVREYLSRPNIYFVLLDTTTRVGVFPIRVRVWRVQPPEDTLFRRVVEDWASQPTSGNFQLHPPCWVAGDLVRNNAGHILFPIMFHAEQVEVGSVDFLEIVMLNFETGLCSEPI